MSLLKVQTENKSKTSSFTLIQSIANKIKYQKLDSLLSLEILQCCTTTHFNYDHTKIIEMWKDIRTLGPTQIQHFITMMQFCQKERNWIGVQQIFDELICSGIRPNRYAQCTLYCMHIFIELNSYFFLNLE